MLSVNGARLLERINELGTIGKDEEGRRTRLAASDTEKQGRDKVVRWMEDADLNVGCGSHRQYLRNLGNRGEQG